MDPVLIGLSTKLHNSGIHCKWDNNPIWGQIDNCANWHRFRTRLSTKKGPLTVKFKSNPIMQTIAISIAIQNCHFRPEKSWYLIIILLILIYGGVFNFKNGFVNFGDYSINQTGHCMIKRLPNLYISTPLPASTISIGLFKLFMPKLHIRLSKTYCT